MPVVTTAEKPRIPLLVARSTGRTPATSGRGADLSEYGRIQPDAAVHPWPVRTGSACAGSATTPLGRVLLVVSDEHLAGLHFDDHPRTPALDGVHRRESDALTQVRTELDEYFKGIRTTFSTPLLLEGTAFQVAVWRALIEIPPGTTATYGEIARKLGRPRAARAVGTANGRNPISIIVPCHRLVGADGGLTGYGWGLDRKRRLLELERQTPGCRTKVSSART
jgi:methylated-DNA-[protein]-cysteine S-methyltransferase